MSKSHELNFISFKEIDIFPSLIFMKISKTYHFYVKKNHLAEKYKFVGRRCIIFWFQSADASWC